MNYEVFSLVLLDNLGEEGMNCQVFVVKQSVNQEINPLKICIAIINSQEPH